MKVFVFLCLFALAFAADDLPKPVEDTPEVAKAKADHLAVHEFVKARNAFAPVPVAAPLAYSAAYPYHYGAYPYNYGAYPYSYTPYSNFGYHYSSHVPAVSAYSAYPYYHY